MFFGFNLEYGLIFKLGKDIVTDWMKYIVWQILAVAKSQITEMIAQIRWRPDS